jgi:hypothetical protein
MTIAQIETVARVANVEEITSCIAFGGDLGLYAQVLGSGVAAVRRLLADEVCGR